jgi:hypothetical protein
MFYRKSQPVCSVNGRVANEDRLACRGLPQHLPGDGRRARLQICPKSPQLVPGLLLGSYARRVLVEVVMMLALGLSAFLSGVALLAALVLRVSSHSAMERHAHALETLRRMVEHTRAEPDDIPERPDTLTDHVHILTEAPIRASGSDSGRPWPESNSSRRNVRKRRLRSIRMDAVGLPTIGIPEPRHSEESAALHPAPEDAAGEPANFTKRTRSTPDPAD